MSEQNRLEIIAAVQADIAQYKAQIQTAIDETQKLMAKEKEQMALAMEGARITQSVQTAEERRNAAVGRLNDALAKGAISEETHRRAMEAEQKAYEDRVGITKKLADAEAAQSKAMEEAADRERQLKEAGAALTRDVQTAQEKYNAKLAEYDRLLKAGAISEETHQRAVKAAKQELDGAGTSWSQHFKTIGEGLSAAGQKLENFGKGIIKYTAVIGGALFGAAVGVTVMGSTFEDKMRLVNNMLELSDAAFDQLKKQVLDTASAMGIGGVEAAEALFKIISGGIPKENAIEFLKTAMKGAVSEGADLNDVIDGLTGTINAFSLKQSDANKVLDIMVSTAHFGSMQFQDLSKYMFHVAQIAGSVKPGDVAWLEETASAIAAITRSGVPADVATTQLKMAIENMIKPSKDGAVVIERLANKLMDQNVNLGEAGRKYKELYEKVKNSSSEYGQLTKQLDASASHGKLTAQQHAMLAKAQKELRDRLKESKGAGKEYSDAMDKLAGPLGQAILKSQGLGGTMKLLQADNDETMTTFDDLYGSVEGVAAVLSLTGKKSGIFIEAMGSIQKAAGTTDRGFQKAMESLGFQWNVAYRTVANGIMRLVSLYGPALAKLFQKVIIPAITGFFKFIEENKDVITKYLNEKIDVLGKKLEVFGKWVDQNKGKIVEWIRSVAAWIEKWGPTILKVGLLATAFGFVADKVGVVVAALNGPLGLIISLGPLGLLGALATLIGTGGMLINFDDKIYNLSNDRFPKLTEAMDTVYKTLKQLTGLFTGATDQLNLFGIKIDNVQRKLIILGVLMRTAFPNLKVPLGEIQPQLGDRSQEALESGDVTVNGNSIDNSRPSGPFGSGKDWNDFLTDPQKRLPDPNEGQPGPRQNLASALSALSAPSLATAGGGAVTNHISHGGSVTLNVQVQQVADLTEGAIDQLMTRASRALRRRSGL